MLEKARRKSRVTTVSKDSVQDYPADINKLNEERSKDAPKTGSENSPPDSESDSLDSLEGIEPQFWDNKKEMVLTRLKKNVNKDARGTIVLYHSTSSSVSEQESEAAEKVELITPDPRIESKYKKSRAKKDKLKRVLKSIYDINPDSRVPSRRQLSNQFWETRFEKNKVFQNNPDYIFESDGESDDEEGMRRPRGPCRGRGSRYYKKIHGMRPTLRTYVVDEDGEKYWYLDKQGRIIRCMFNCCEGFVGEMAHRNLRNSTSIHRYDYYGS
ncbi:hypothetical protein TWF173_005270 [Orbilia oligospora]|nr:hypothetical protein TWF173_005270 [Orbilia oligospora]